jgi:CubicO group peptidase (beta-lactamase class C family)
MTVVSRVHPYNIHGFVAPGFELVKEKFIENFETKNELGASICVYQKGEKVVDLWGGYRDKDRKLPWNDDTMIIVFSTTKGMSSLALGMLHSRGLFDYDDKVVKYWPEFGQNGKEDITIRTLLAHQAGLCGMDRILRVKTLNDSQKMCDILSKQIPAWHPGDHQGYHAWTIAFYMDQLIRKIDTQGRGLSQFFHQEIAEPLNQPFYIGLPKDIETEKLAKLVPFSNLEFFRNSDPDRKKASLDLIKPWTLKFKALLNPRFTMNLNNFNKYKFQSLPIGSACGFGNARSIASIYNEFVMGGKNLGIMEKTLMEFENPPIMPRKWEKDLVLDLPVYFSLGMAKPSKHLVFGTNQKAFGSFGAGGSGGFCEPERKVAYSYVMNKMGTEISNDPREVVLRKAVWKCLENLEGE